MQQLRFNWLIGSLSPRVGIIGLVLFAAAFGGMNLPSAAEIIVLSDDFDAHPPGAFGNAYNYGDAAANPSSIIVSPGAGGAGQALQFSANLHGGTNANTGVNLPAYS